MTIVVEESNKLEPKKFETYEEALKYITDLFEKESDKFYSFKIIEE